MGRCACGEKPGCTNIGGKRRICARRSRRNPTGVCHNWPMKGRDCCRMHGATSVAGPVHPNWKGGIYSKVLPRGLAAHYAEARENPALIALTEQIALVDAKIVELLEQLVRGESPAAWAQVLELAEAQRAALTAFHQARRPPVNVLEMTAALARLGTAIGQLADVAARGVHDAKAWSAITSQIYLRKKLVDSEVKRQKLAHDTLTKDRALSIMGFIAASIARHVSDPKAKRAIVEDIRPLLTAVGDTDER